MYYRFPREKWRDLKSSSHASATTGLLAILAIIVQTILIYWYLMITLKLPKDRLLDAEAHSESHPTTLILKPTPNINNHDTLLLWLPAPTDGLLHLLHWFFFSKPSPTLLTMSLHACEAFRPLASAQGYSE